MEELKNDFKIEVEEKKPLKVDNRAQVIHDLGINTDHPIFKLRQAEFERLTPEIQCLFYTVVKQEMNEYDEEIRQETKHFRIREKLNSLKNQRKKQTRDVKL